jgi:hypothetical protein
MTRGAVRRPFADVPETAIGHLRLYLYVAAARLAAACRRLGTTREWVFLTEYEDEFRTRLADDRDRRDLDIRATAALDAWERTCDTRLPLHALGGDLGLDPRRRLAFALAGLPEEDSRFGQVFEALQGGGRRPTVETLGRVLASGDADLDLDGWRLCRPLVECGLLAIEDPDALRSEQALRPPPLVWDAVRDELGQHPWPGGSLLSCHRAPRIDELTEPPEFLARLDRVPRLLDDRRATLVLLRHTPGADVERIAAALARRLGRSLLRFDRAATDTAHLRQAGAVCTLAGALPFFELETAPGETFDPPRLAGYAGPVVVALGLEGGLRPDAAGAPITLDVPFPGPALREQAWRDALAQTRVESLEAVRDGFQIPGGYIRTVARSAIAQSALDGSTAVRTSDVRVATRLLNRQLLDSLAQPIGAAGRWSDLVASSMTTDALAELQQRCVCRERLASQVGPAFRASVGRGVRALLAGASGTGKTMAARILAAELGMDLYRVDLAAVVNKYVGETEKNLHLVLARAEALDVVLLLDEGDALLGRRSEVKSSNDRYANLETNYLLQRLEGYQGIAIVTTNFAENIDPAFQRRMDVVVPFFAPRADERRRIWALHLPDDHAVDPEWLERVVQRCTLTGGQIRNAVLQGAALALEARSALTRAHLHTAVLREYQKAGASFPLAGHGVHRRRAHGGLHDFVAALRAR